MTRTVVHFTDSTGFGGAEQALLQLLKGLDRGQWRPILMHHADPGIEPLLSGARELGVETRAQARLPLGPRGLGQVPRLARLLRAERPALFHAHLTWPLACKYALVAAIVAQVPAILATLQLYVEAPYSALTRVQQRLVAAGVDRYIAVSNDVARRLACTFGIPRRKINVIHNSVDLEKFCPRTCTDPSANPRPGAQRPTVLTVARLDEQKGLGYLIDAARLVPEADFLVAGDGPERSRLEERARALQLNDRLTFLGHRQDVSSLLDASDLFVLPSLYEGLPLSILEAMAARRPVIATAIPGTDEAVTDGQTGLLVPPGDSQALACAIHRLLSDWRLADRLAAAGQARAKHEFSTGTMVHRIAQVYDDVLSSRKPWHGHR